MSSGDVGRFDDDGRLYVEGRDDEMIVSGGENVFPQEVEDCLVAARRASTRSAAIGVDDDDFGKRLRRSSCAPRRRRRARTTSRTHVKENLARFKVPREIVFLDELPRNATGKVLKRELATELSDPIGPARARRNGDRTRARRRGPRLHAARPVRPGRHAVVVPRPQGGGDRLLPVRLLRRLHRRDGRHPRPARRVPDLRHRGARDLVRPGLRAAGLRRPTGSTSRCSRTSGRTARWPAPTTSSTRRRAAPRRSSYVVDKEGPLRWSVHNAMPEGRDLDEHLRQLHAAVA